jgi:hypothetical protein
VSSPDPQAPVEAGHTSPSTQEIPVVQPAGGATATSQLPPHPKATTPAPVQPVGTPTMTSPVDFVPGPPGAGTPSPPPHSHAARAPAVPAAADPAPATAPVPAAPTETATASAASPAPSWSDSVLPDGPAGHPRGKLRSTLTGRRPWDRAALPGLALVALGVVLLELGLSLDLGGQSYWSSVPLWSAFATVCALLAFAAYYPAGDRGRSGAAWRVAVGGLAGVAVFWLLVVLPVVDTDRGFVLTAALGALGGALWMRAPRKA